MQPQTVVSQGITADARILTQAGTAIRLSGSLTLRAEARLDGIMILTGHLEDHHGMQTAGGLLLFNGDGSRQVISGNGPTRLNNLEIAPGACVHISPEKMLTVAGQLTNNNATDGLVLEADNQGNTASLLHYNENVNASVEKYFTGAAGTFHTLSSPVKAQNFEPVFISTGDHVFAWFEPSQTYVSYANTFNYPSFLDANDGVLQFLPATGYYVSYYFFGGQSNPKLFSGPLQQGSIGFILEYKAHPEDDFPGRNFMGNPYPSAIDWNAEEGWTGKEHLIGEEGTENKVIWVWNAELQNYGAVLPRARTSMHNDVTGIIPAMAGFWVSAAEGSDGEILAMDDGVRLHGSAVKEGATPDEDQLAVRISLSANDSSLADEVVIEFGHDGGPVGAEKMFSPNAEAPQLFVIHNEEKYSILLLGDADYRDADLRDGYLHDNGFHDDDLHDDDLHDVDLRDNGFHGVDLHDVDLHIDDLHDVDLRDGVFREDDGRDGLGLGVQTPSTGAYTLSISGSHEVMRRLAVHDTLSGRKLRTTGQSMLSFSVPGGLSGESFVLYFEKITPR